MSHYIRQNIFSVYLEKILDVTTDHKCSFKFDKFNEFSVRIFIVVGVHHCSTVCASLVKQMFLKDKRTVLCILFTVHGITFSLIECLFVLRLFLVHTNENVSRLKLCRKSFVFWFRVFDFCVFICLFYVLHFTFGLFV